MIDMESTGLRISASLDNKTRQKYGLFATLSIAAIQSCEVDKNPNIFLMRESRHIQEVSRHFGGTLNNYDTMVFAENQEQNISYTFKDMLLQPD